MKTLFAFFFALAFTGTAFAQDTTRPRLYNPSADATLQLTTAAVQAGREGKHVFVQVGGNWCVWCIRFHQLCVSDTAISRILRENYVVVHLNYSPENKNEKALASLGYPQRFGFPVFVILNGKGKRLHTQNSAYLEEGKGHSSKKVQEFLLQWTPGALDPKQYREH